jgi:hypothetical protein
MQVNNIVNPASLAILILCLVAYYSPGQPQQHIPIDRSASIQEAIAMQEAENERILLIDDDASLKILIKATQDIKDPWLRALIKQDLLNRYRERVTEYKKNV